VNLLLLKTPFGNVLDHVVSFRTAKMYAGCIQSRKVVQNVKVVKTFTPQKSCSERSTNEITMSKNSTALHIVGTQVLNNRVVTGDLQPQNWPISYM